MPLPFRRNCLAVLRSVGNFDPRLRTVQRRHFELSAQGGRGHGNRHLAIKIGAVALEELVRLQGQENIKIPGRTAAQARFALTRQANAGAIFDAGRNIDRERALFGRCGPGPSTWDKDP